MLLFHTFMASFYIILFIAFPKGNDKKIAQHTHFVTLIVPTYKQRAIVSNIRALKKVADNIKYDYEIIVVIDGKVDNTFQKIAKGKNTKNPRYSVSYQSRQKLCYSRRYA
ncbi:MAG: hypothetical protein UZ22_OP11002001067 [Microgenomates bacterium OLB23]|nr:MAG: hypothetical protein UZ22_OP11002001067 [Microgenomates bacterium OLB23]